MVEAFSDEEIKGPCAAPHRGCSFGKWEKWPYECLDCRYLATITAGRKRIEELEKRVKIMGDCIDEMDNQTAEIERLRGLTGDCIAIMEQFHPDMDAPRLLEYNADLSGQIEIAHQALGGKE